MLLASNVDGPVSGQNDGELFRGEFSAVMTIAMGQVTGSNSHGKGGAIWSRFAEAAYTRASQWRQGGSALTVAELPIPSIRVDIDVPG